MRKDLQVYDPSAEYSEPIGRAPIPKHDPRFVLVVLPLDPRHDPEEIQRYPGRVQAAIDLEKLLRDRVLLNRLHKVPGAAWIALYDSDGIEISRKPLLKLVGESAAPWPRCAVRAASAQKRRSWWRRLLGWRS